jgi:flagellar basal-body rod protein FlgB
VQLAATNATYTVERFDREAPMLPSGNTVGLEDELMKAGEVRRGMEINTSVVKSFHRMLMMTARP